MATRTAPVLDLLGKMTADSIERRASMPRRWCSRASPRSSRSDAPPASYMLNLGAASEIGIDAEQIQAF